MADNIRVLDTKLYGLDHLRAFAIMFVLLFHYQFFGAPQWVHDIAKFGWTGVDLFFVLSGYLISSHLFAEETTTGTISLRIIEKSFLRLRNMILSNVKLSARKAPHPAVLNHRRHK
ncbi:hypothetical protein A0256_06655 [Mucilaginibacter sp. PAMC 26640]|nr:hypothetical protein A0256_06655 [Mucilaginibacter sp. PAMC 26640]